MRWKLLDAGPPATDAAVLAKGNEVMSELGHIVREQKIEPPAHPRKRKDPETGLVLIDLERS